jgi:hypothetical protein
MKRLFVVLILVLSSSHAAPGRLWAAQDWTGNVNLLLGIKYFDNVVWDSAGQLETGIDVDFRHKSWPVNIALGISGAYDLDVSTTEYRIGVRKIFEATPRMRPFIGCGIDYVSAEEDEFFNIFDDEEDSDTGVGGWIDGGIYWTFGNRVNAGFDLGYSYAPVTLSGKTANAGGIRLDFLLGYHW